jgi:hypothetical protein
MIFPNSKDTSGMHSRYGKATYEMFRIIQNKDSLIHPEKHKKELNPYFAKNAVLVVSYFYEGNELHAES